MSKQSKKTKIIVAIILVIVAVVVDLLAVQWRRNYGYQKWDWEGVNYMMRGSFKLKESEEDMRILIFGWKSKIDTKNTVLIRIKNSFNLNPNGCFEYYKNQREKVGDVESCNYEIIREDDNPVAYFTIHMKDGFTEYAYYVWSEKRVFYVSGVFSDRNLDEKLCELEKIAKSASFDDSVCSYEPVFENEWCKVEPPEGYCAYVSPATGDVNVVKKGLDSIDERMNCIIIGKSESDKSPERQAEALAESLNGSVEKVVIQNGIEAYKISNVLCSDKNENLYGDYYFYRKDNGVYSLGIACDLNNPDERQRLDEIFDTIELK